jgi:predicted aspartyl protease
MKNIILILLSAMTLAACSPKSNPATEHQMLQMLDKKDVFRLETLLEEKRSQLSKTIVLYLEAHLQNAFNRTEQSLQTIDVLFDRYGKSLNDTLLFNLLSIKYDNLLKQNRYREAAEALKIALDKYSHASDSVKLDDSWNAYNSIEPLKTFPPQKMHITSDVTIPVSRNQFNHLMVRVTSGGQSEDFIFDTGATLSGMSESMARRMGIHVLESSLKVGNSIGSKIHSKVGVADSLWIGDVLFENVALLVVSDEICSFPEVNYFIHGVIGFPIMYQMKEIRIRKDESITVAARPTKRNLHNLFLDGDSPVVQVETDNDTLLFHMDTGANKSEFSGKYFAAYQNEILEKAVLEKVKRGGAGGFIDSEEYKLENVWLKIGGHELTVPKISVYTEEMSFLENYDGNLGQDVLMHFNQLILNFEDMYLTFED